MKQSLKLTLLSLVLAAAFSACGKIPDAYQGKFQDLASGAKLDLGGSSGELTFTSGRQIKSDAADLDFEKLLKGEPGIYLRSTSDNADEVEVFWLLPHKETRKQEFDFVWLESEVLYSRMNIKLKDKVQQMKMLHCENGMVMLDLPTKTWNGGCPAGASEYDFVRKE